MAKIVEIGKFIDNAEGKRGGQFYTPASIVNTLLGVLAPHQGKVYDPCCGSGEVEDGSTVTDYENQPGFCRSVPLAEKLGEQIVRGAELDALNRAKFGRLG